MIEERKSIQIILIMVPFNGIIFIKELFKIIDNMRFNFQILLV